MKSVWWCLLMMMAAGVMSVSDGAAQEYTLKDLYQQALNNSEIIKFAEENVYIAQLGRNKAVSLLIPRVTAFGTYSRFSEEKYTMAGTLIQPEESGTWGVRADQAFSLSAREWDALKIAGQSIVKSEYDLSTAKSDFVVAVAASYYDVLKAKRALEIAAANLERLTQYRYFVERRVSVGELTKTALLRAAGELSGARADYLRATNAFKLSRAALIRITGIEENFQLREEEEATLPKPYALDLLKKTALASRTDLKSYDLQTQIAAKQVKYARGAFWPSLGVFAIYNRADQNPATAALNRESILAGVSLSFPFFEGGLRIAELKEAKARQRQAQWVYEDLKKDVDVELTGAYLELETLKGSLVFLKDQQLFAEDNYNAVLRQLDHGLATSLDVMDANTLLLNAQRNVADALYNYQMAHLKMKRSSGTLLEFVASNP